MKGSETSAVDAAAGLTDGLEEKPEQVVYDESELEPDFEEEVEDEEFMDRLLQVRRVTKVVKGGKQLSFRAVVVVGNEDGLVGVGVASAKEVIVAVAKAITDARKFVVS